MFFKKKIRKCICISLKPYKMELIKVMKLKTILKGFTFITHIFLQIIKGQGPLEQWFPTGGTRTPGGTRNPCRGYAKVPKLI